MKLEEYKKKKAEFAEIFTKLILEKTGLKAEELELLDDFAVVAREELGVRGSDVRQDADGGVDNVGQHPHLVGTGDARLEHGNVVLVGHLPDGERHPEAGIVAVGTLHHLELVVQDGGKPLFDNGFAVAAGDADDRVTELLAMFLRQPLQGRHGVFHEKEIGVQTGGVAFHHFGNHKVADSRLV